LALEPDEASWHSAVSRAYYAEFHVGREFLTALRFGVPQSAHAYLWLRLQNCGDALIQQAESDLNDLRTRRNHADYDLRRAYPVAHVARWVQVAEAIILALESAAADPARAAAIEAA
jgi:uncharacterized protein (UPF0332 family)